MPLCSECYGCGLELAFPPVEAKEMGGWIAYWPQGPEGALVYRRTCRACEGLGVAEAAANLSLSRQRAEHAETPRQTATWLQSRPVSWAQHQSVLASLLAFLFG